MGAERWMQFTTTEARRRAHRIVDALGAEVVVDGTDVWLEWTRGRLEVAHTHGYGNSTLATLVCREIAKRCPVARIGADSVGWYRAEDWTHEGPDSATVLYGPHASWAQWITNYKIEWSTYWPPSKAGQQKLRDLDAAVVDLFKTLDAQATHARKRP